MIGIGSAATTAGSPMVKRTVVMKANCMMALRTTEKIIERGTRTRVFFTSSDMCMTPSVDM